MTKAIKIRSGYAWYVVLLLAILSVVSYADRLVLAILVQPVKAELGVSDTAMGFLLGFSFSLVYAILAFALARVADRWNRRKLIIIGVIIWSVMTSASAFSEGFWQLAFCRFGVGIGEAALGPAALSIISDLFVKEKRHLPVSVFLAAGVVGATGAYIIGGAAIMFVSTMTATSLPLVGELSAWRMVFLFMGIPGLLLSLLMIFTVKEPERREHDGKVNATYADIIAHVKSRAYEYGPIFLGLGLLQSVLYAFSAWFPSILIRSHGIENANAGIYYGTIGLIFGTLGAIFGPYMAGRLQRGGRKDGVFLICLIFICLPLPFVFLSLTTASAVLALMSIAIILFSFMASSAMPPLLPQLIAPNSIRAQITAIYFFMGNILGLGFGPLLVGIINDNDILGASNLNQSIIVLAAIIMPIAILLLAVGLYEFKRRDR